MPWQWWGAGSRTSSHHMTRAVGRVVRLSMHLTHVPNCRARSRAVPALTATLVTAAVVVSMAGFPARFATAQQPPNRFFGRVTLNGASPLPGTPVLALINNKVCGSGEVRADGRYVVDVEDDTRIPGCGTPGATITFQVGGIPAGPTGAYRRGVFTELWLIAPAPTPSPTPSPSPTATATPAASPPPSVLPGPTPAPQFSEAALLLTDSPPCIPEPGTAACDAERAALWSGDLAAWGARGVATDDERFAQIVLLRARAGEPSVISNIARILGNPFLQITRLRFVGAAAEQADEYIEITNLGGGSQEMTGWIVRSPLRDAVSRFPSGYAMAAGQSCRIYTSQINADSCGDATFASRDVWPDDSGTAILFYEALALPGAERAYNSDPANQPPPPNLRGVQ